MLTGTPMVLVRTQGCSVGCPWCDTKETWHTKGAPVTSLSALLAEPRPNPTGWEASGSKAAEGAMWLSPSVRWVLLTGGEPGEQHRDDLLSFSHALRSAGRRLAIETSGTSEAVLVALADHLCVSPKLDMPGGLAVLPNVMSCATEVKMVIGRQADIDALDELLERCPTLGQVYLQPLSCSSRATQLCIDTCLERGDWRLSIQTHKGLGLP